MQVEKRRTYGDIDALHRRDAWQKRGDELLRLADGLMHLPVARDERGTPARCRAHVKASTPGSRLPSISSSVAPPPVDRCVTSPSRPNFRNAAADSPPATP